jgi:hypothetical protein
MGSEAPRQVRTSGHSSRAKNLLALRRAHAQRGPAPRPGPSAHARAAISATHSSPRPAPTASREARSIGNRRGARAGRRAEVSAAVAGPAVVGCAALAAPWLAVGRRLGGRPGWLGSGLGRRPGLRSALLRGAPGQRLPAGGRGRAAEGGDGGRAATLGRAAAPRGGDRPMDPRGPASQTPCRRDGAQDVGLGRDATKRTGRRLDAAATGARGRLAHEDWP